MSSILNRVQLFLTEANKASVPISSTIINEFGEACKDAFIKQFVEERETKFKPRMSSIGRPLCQLQMEKSGAETETPAYNSKMRFIFGDLIEALAVAVLKSSGVKIDEFQKKVKYVFGDDEINGTYDVKIMDKIWDIKSASPYSFQYKFGESGGFESLLKDDPFGYVPQGYLYAGADDKEFGGWIAINKSTGEWLTCEAPLADDEYKATAIKNAEDNMKSITEKKPFKRCYSDIEETFRTKKTGNKVLGFVCSFCPYKLPCWGSKLQLLPQQQSQGKNPKWVWYTEVKNPKKDETMEAGGE